jgi:hypothetical protein
VRLARCDQCITPLKVIRHSSIADACDEWISVTHRNETVCEKFNIVQFRHLELIGTRISVAGRLRHAKKQLRSMMAIGRKVFRLHRFEDVAP